MGSIHWKFLPLFNEKVRGIGYWGFEEGFSFCLVF